MISTTTPAPGSFAATTTTTTPNDVIESMTGRRYVSWSQLTSYRSCPRKWFFSHVEALEPEFVASSLLFGSAFHAAVQYHYEHQLIGQSVSAAQLCDAFQTAWKAERGERQVRYSKDETEDTITELASRMLAAFSESSLAQPEGSLIAIEETLTGTVHPQMPDLLARVDVIWQSDDGFHLMDVKTSKCRWSDSKLTDQADQLLLYSQLVEQLTGRDDLQLHFGIVTKAKSPATQLLPVEFNPQRSDNTLKMMLPVWNGMKAGIDYANPNPLTCSTCPFKSRCPAHR